MFSPEKKAYGTLVWAVFGAHLSLTHTCPKEGGGANSECNSSELNEAGVKEHCIRWDVRGRRRRSNFPLRYLNMMPPINHTLPRCLSLPSPIRTARTIMRQMGLSKSNSTVGVR